MTGDTAGGATQRLFFALWPPEDLREALAAIASRYIPDGRGRHGARRTAARNLHLTLAFLGSVDAARRRAIEALASDIRGSAFELRLDRLGHWPRPRILWCGASEAPAPLVDLAVALAGAMRASGLEPERRPFHAHVTLARKVRSAPTLPEPPPLAWPVDRFVLVRSRTLPAGPVYEVQREFALGQKD